MTLDEAISEEEKRIKMNEKDIKERFNTYPYIGQMHACMEQANRHRQLAEWLKELKQLREQTQWIPVSERLPETHQDVLLELRSGEILTGFKAETELYFYCHGADGCYVEPQNVLAWMPLPEPYKAEKGGEE